MYLFVFSWLFPISFARSTLTELPGCLLLILWQSLFSLTYLSNLGPDFFLSCLGNFRCCFHSSLRLFVTSLFLIIVSWLGKTAKSLFNISFSFLFFSFITKVKHGKISCDMSQSHRMVTVMVTVIICDKEVSWQVT